jgi:hypothetical protein
MSCQHKFYRPEIQDSGREILLAQIFYSSRFLYPSGDGRTIVRRDVKLFDNRIFFVKPLNRNNVSKLLHFF